MEQFHFANLAELRDFLNGFKITDLSVVLPESADHFHLKWMPMTLTDGSEVINVKLETV